MAERWKERAEEYLHDLRSAGERAWAATQRTVTEAGARGIHYGRLTQRRIDLAAVERSIERLHRDLGRTVFAAWKGGWNDLLGHRGVAGLVARLSATEERRADLAREIEALRGQPAAGDEAGAAPLADREVRAAEEDERAL